MNTSTDLADVLDVLSKILLWCFAMGFLVLLIWLVAFLAAGDLIHGIHASMFDLSEHEFDLMYSYGMALFKLCIFIFYFFPYVAIRLVVYRLARN